MAAAILRDRWQRLLQFAERRLPALTRYRKSEALPIQLHARRIYILPTAFGMLFGSMLVVMLLGALNFGNNAALLLTFALAGAVQISLPRTVRHLDRIELSAVRANAVHAGEDTVLRLHLRALDGRRRVRLSIASGSRSHRFDLAEDAPVPSLGVPTHRRGWLAVGRLTLSTTFPFGLFRAWSVLHPEARVLVYPRPETHAPPLPRHAAQAPGALLGVTGDDWHGLREYRGGDATRLIAWKASARQDRLLVREYETPRNDELVLDHAALGGLDAEQRIARLTRWVLDAAAANLSYRLILPTQSLGPARGEEHLAACLRELALLP